MVEIKERKETEGTAEGADGKGEGVEMMAAVVGRGCMERASGREGSPEEEERYGFFLNHVRKLVLGRCIGVELGLAASAGALWGLCSRVFHT